MGLASLVNQIKIFRPIFGCGGLDSPLGMLWEHPTHIEKFTRNLSWLVRVQEQIGDLTLVVSGFHEGVNLITFSLDEVF
jgi:hypothetical protein